MRHIYRLYERNLMKPSRFDFAVTVYNRFVSFTGCLPWIDAPACMYTCIHMHHQRSRRVCIFKFTQELFHRRQLRKERSEVRILFKLVSRLGLFPIIFFLFFLSLAVSFDPSRSFFSPWRFPKIDTFQKIFSKDLLKNFILSCLFSFVIFNIRNYR